MALSIQMIAVLSSEDLPRQMQQYALMLDEALGLTDIVCFGGGHPIILRAFEGGFMSENDHAFWVDHSAELHGPPRSFQGAISISRFVKHQMSLEHMGKPLEAGSIIKVGVFRHDATLPVLYFTGAVREIRAIELVAERNQQL